jgi:glycosyltransferase involved in cell wall biosynthesis
MTRLAIFSHKQSWEMSSSPSCYATDGGFPFQTRALSELFDETVIVVPCLSPASRSGEIPLIGNNISVVPLSMPAGSGIKRKISMFFWLVRNLRIVTREVRRADAIHTPIPSDIGTVGMLVAFIMRKPLFVRHCGNWQVQKTAAERFWKWFMERFAGGRNVMLATGGAVEPPSRRNPAIQWIFSTSLTRQELSECRIRRDCDVTARLRLIISCRQEERKGTDIVIRTLPLLIDEFPGVSLDVVGDGSLMRKLQLLSETLSLSDRVKFHGKVDHHRVLELLQQADLFCYPTTASEGFPKAVLEALACGLPVVTTRVSVLEQLMKNGCGLLIEEAQPKALAEGIRRCLASREQYRAMSERAIETASQYSLESWRDSIADSLVSSWGPLTKNARLGIDGSIACSESAH